MKSIFKGVAFTKRYRAVESKQEYFDDRSAIRYPKILEPTLKEWTDKSFENFYEFDVDKPPFQVKENVYIDALDIEVTVERVVRSVEGYYIYTCSYLIRTDENLEEKATEELKLQEMWSVYWEKKQKEDEWTAKWKKEEEEKNFSKKWYQFWK